MTDFATPRISLATPMIPDHITVADMIAALSRLPDDARLVVTHSGYYCYDDFADIFMPRPVDADGNTLLDLCGTELNPLGYNHDAFVKVR